MEESERYRQLLNEKQRDRGLLLQARARIFAPSISKRGSKQFSTSEWPATAYEIGRASCRERVCPYVSTLVDAVSIQKTNAPHPILSHTRHIYIRHTHTI